MKQKCKRMLKYSEGTIDRIKKLRSRCVGRVSARIKGIGRYVIVIEIWNTHFILNITVLNVSVSIVSDIWYFNDTCVFYVFNFSRMIGKIHREIKWNLVIPIFA